MGSSGLGIHYGQGWGQPCHLRFTASRRTAPTDPFFSEFLTRGFARNWGHQLLLLEGVGDPSPALPSLAGGPASGVRMELRESLNYCLLSVPQLIGFRVTLAALNRFPLLGSISWKRESPLEINYSPFGPPEGRGLQPRVRGGLHASRTGPRACAALPTHLSSQNILGQSCPRGPRLPCPSWHEATHLYQ